APLGDIITENSKIPSKIPSLRAKRSNLIQVLISLNNEIAPSALLPRNDGILNEISRSSRGMTQGLGILEFALEF
ncbi:MAG: hypothetical protein MSS71_05970, partial [Campylobacter sp.]|uniref:hypothetical protein n=1 Tax=Campylobacter sp. TaxID=205 RepID=UPI002AA69F98